MAYVTPVLLLAVGLVAVIKGGDWFVDAATRIARASGIPSFIIGATIVSLATTLPEILVSTVAAGTGKNDMAIGNAVGSVTANTGLIMSLACIFLVVVISRREYLFPCLLLIAAASTLLLGCLGGKLSIVVSVILLGIFITFMVYNVQHAKKQSGGDAAARREPMDRKALLKDIALFLVGAAAIVVGSDLLVDNGSTLAVLLGVPERIIAITLVSIGTSLPELVTTLTAIRKKEASLSVGNIIGANIIDLSLILPLCSFISGKPLPISADNLMWDLPACLLVILLMLVPLLVREKASKTQGIFCLAVYGAYLVISSL